MKSKKLLLLGCLALGVSFGASAQVYNATQPDLFIAPAMNNTGLAIAPNLDLQAAVFADGFGSYRIYWIEESTGTVVDIAGNSGYDPDVAYYANADAVVVAYENGGDIYVDDYYLATLFPTPNYNPGTTTGISGGNYPNVDISSQGRGVLCWENGGDVWACTFQIGPFIASPPVNINQGVMPDIILLDDGNTVALTYIDISGSLIVETLDGSALGSGFYSPLGIWGFTATTGYEYPRIASQRNSMAGFGPVDDFAVVAQDFNGSSYEVHTYFANGGGMTGVMEVSNLGFLGCSTFDPLPVIAYDRNVIHVAWSQDYTGPCGVGIAQSNPNFRDDVLLTNYDLLGNPIPMPVPVLTTFPVRYEEVNQVVSNFSAISKTSISTEYDGNYMITSGNFHEGILFNDPGDLFWKARNAGNPTFISASNLNADRGSNFSLVTSPVDQTIEILSESDDLASFQLLDNAGRVVELKSISNNDNTYIIDISHLSGGMYFLNCSSIAGQEVLRILQVTK